MKKKVLAAVLAAAVLMATGCTKKDEKWHFVDEKMMDTINVCPWTCETTKGLTGWEKGQIISSSLTQWIAAFAAISGAAAAWATYFRDSGKISVSEWIGKEMRTKKAED